MTNIANGSPENFGITSINLGAKTIDRGGFLELNLLRNGFFNFIELGFVEWVFGAEKNL